MLFQGVAGRTVYLSGLEYFAFQNNGKISSIALNRWTEETKETADYPRLSTLDNPNNFRYSSFWQRNGNFLKLRSIELGYTFSPKILQKSGINGTRFYINGTNLFSWDKVKYNDPERPWGSAGYPPTRTINMGLKFDF